MVVLLISVFLLVPIIASSAAAPESTRECPALKEPRVKHFDIKLPNNVLVPPQQTFYVCQQYKVRLSFPPSHLVNFDVGTYRLLTVSSSSTIWFQPCHTRMLSGILLVTKLETDKECVPWCYMFSLPPLSPSPSLNRPFKSIICRTLKIRKLWIFITVDIAWWRS